MSRGFFVIGAGGHGKVVTDTLISMGETVRTITDLDPLKHGHAILGIPVAGDDSLIAEQDPKNIYLALGVGIGAGGVSEGLELRRSIYNRFTERGYAFGQVIDPSAIVSVNTELGCGVQIMSGSIVQPGVRVEENAIINTHSSVDHDCIIGAHSHVAPGCTLGGGVTVEEGAHISIGAIIAPNVRVGAGSVVAAGATVLNDVAPGSFVCGTPAKEKDNKL